MPLHPVFLLDAWQIILYIVIILVALVSLVAIVAIILLVQQILGLVKQVRGEIKPLLDQAQETVRTVQGTTEFVSAGLVKPGIQIASVAAGVARTISVLRSGVFQPKPGTAPRDTVISKMPDGETTVYDYDAGEREMLVRTVKEG